MGGWEGVGMVAAGGAGLNINPRGRPGRAPVLVRLRLNPRNHAVGRPSPRALRESCRVIRGKEGSSERERKARGTSPLPFADGAHVIGRCDRRKEYRARERVVGVSEKTHERGTTTTRCVRNDGRRVITSQ